MNEGHRVVPDESAMVELCKLRHKHQKMKSAFKWERIFHIVLNIILSGIILYFLVI